MMAQVSEHEVQASSDPRVLAWGNTKICDAMSTRNNLIVISFNAYRTKAVMQSMWNQFKF